MGCPLKRESHRVAMWDLGPGPVALPVVAVGGALAHFLDDVADGGHVACSFLSLGSW